MNRGGVQLAGYCVPPLRSLLHGPSATQNYTILLVTPIRPPAAAVTSSLALFRSSLRGMKWLAVRASLATIPA